MSRRGPCWESAGAERVVAPLTVELGHAASGAPRGPAQGEFCAPIELLSRPAAALRPQLPEPAHVRALGGDGGGTTPGATVAGPRRGGVREREGRRGSRSHAEEGGRYLGIPPGARRDPHQQHPWYPPGCSADTGRNPSSVSPHPLTAGSTAPGRVRPCIAVQHLTTPLFLSKLARPPHCTHPCVTSRPRLSHRPCVMRYA
jgi:hypothetical protein